MQHFCNVSLVSLSVYPRSRRGAEWIRQGKVRWSLLPKTALERSDLTEKFQFLEFHTEAETEKLLTKFLSPKKKESFYIYIPGIYIFCTLLLSSFWTRRCHRCRPFFPPVLAFNFYRALGSAIPLLVGFSSSVANSRSHAFRKSICAQEKVPRTLYEYALGKTRTHETDLYQTRG